MAKSLRSKSKRQFRRVKREDPKSAFQIAENLRLQRLSSKLKSSALKPRALTDAEEYERKQEGYETEDELLEEDADVQVADADAEREMQIEGSVEEEKKAEMVSTAGPRMSRRELYRTQKKFQVRLPRKTEFRARGEKKRMGCKPQRRR